MKILTFMLLSALIFITSCRDSTKGKARAADAKARVTTELKAALKEKTIAPGSAVFIRAFKEERELEMFLKNKKSGNYELFRTYPIAGMSGDLGPKLAEGDRQVPEGFYAVGPGAMNPNSSYHLAFNIGFPNAYDRANERTGSYIMVHGSTASIGCLAMTDEKIEEIYTLCEDAFQAGQPFFRIHIFPFRMTKERMTMAAKDKWLPFWKNLKTGYDLFEKNKVPPNVTVKGKEYAFDE